MAVSQQSAEFIKHFYAISDNPDATDAYCQAFTEDARIKFGNATTPASALPQLRRAMWDQVSSRRHTVTQVFTSESSTDLMIQGYVDLAYTNGHKAPSIDWSALMQFADGDGPPKMRYYQVFFDSSPGKAAKDRKALSRRHNVTWEGNLLVLSEQKKLHVEIEGQGPPVILLHGLGGSTDFYTTMLDYCSFKNHCQVILVDLDGHGSSPFSGQISQKSLIEDVLGIIEALQLTRVTLVGHSFASLIVLPIATRLGDRISKVITIGGLAQPTDATKKVMLQRAARARQEGMYAIAQAVPEAAFSRASKENNRLGYNFVSSLIKNNNPAAYAATCEVINRAELPDLSSTQAAVLLIGGEEDSLAPPAQLNVTAKQIPQCEVVILRDVGHWHGIEGPRELAGLIDHFIDY